MTMREIEDCLDGIENSLSDPKLPERVRRNLKERVSQLVHALGVTLGQREKKSVVGKYFKPSRN